MSCDNGTVGAGDSTERLIPGECKLAVKHEQVNQMHALFWGWSAVRLPTTAAVPSHRPPGGCVRVPRQNLHRDRQYLRAEGVSFSFSTNFHSVLSSEWGKRYLFNHPMASRQRMWEKY